MRLPRDLTGAQLIRALQKIGYEPTRTTGSHVRLTCSMPSQHHVTVPLHDPLRIGTLAGILDAVAMAQGKGREELRSQLFG